MRVPNRCRSTGLEFNMTPMVDIVFLLIIFFLVSSHLASQEVELELDLPGADTGQTPGVDRTPRVTINVLGDGRVLLAGQSVAPDELGRRLRYESARVGLELEVRLRCDRRIAYRQVEPILVSCARAAIWNVGIAVIERNQVSEEDPMNRIRAQVE